MRRLDMRVRMRFAPLLLGASPSPPALQRPQRHHHSVMLLFASSSGGRGKQFDVGAAVGPPMLLPKEAPGLNRPHQRQVERAAQAPAGCQHRPLPGRPPLPSAHPCRPCPAPPARTPNQAAPGRCRAPPCPRPLIAARYTPTRGGQHTSRTVQPRRAITG